MTLTEGDGVHLPPTHSWNEAIIFDIAQHWLENEITEVWITVPGEVILFFGRCTKAKGLKLEEAKDDICRIPPEVNWAGKTAVVTARIISLFAACAYVKMAQEYNKSLKKDASNRRKDRHPRKIPCNTNTNAARSTSNHSTRTEAWVMSQNRNNSKDRHAAEH